LHNSLDINFNVFNATSAERRLYVSMKQTKTEQRVFLETCLSGLAWFYLFTADTTRERERAEQFYRTMLLKFIQKTDFN
jgi:hypothetical protein